MADIEKQNTKSKLVSDGLEKNRDMLLNQLNDLKNKELIQMKSIKNFKNALLSNFGPDCEE